MRSELSAGAYSAFAWLIFPLVPALLGSTYHGLYDLGNHGTPDPRDWDWFAWGLLMGPLVGYGFLAGATLGLPDEPGRPGIGAWLSRSSVWVAVGPWVGFLSWVALLNAMQAVVAMIAWVYPASREWSGLPESFWQETRSGWLLRWVLSIGGFGWFAYGWVLVAWVVLRRAKRLGRHLQSLLRGLMMALGFVGSLIGTFWAITEVWRGYFFDPRTMPILVAATSLALMAGCGGTVTYGEVRRRELFQALLMAWLLGLALTWRWWSRPRSKPPGP